MPLLGASAAGTLGAQPCTVMHECTPIKHFSHPRCLAAGAFYMRLVGRPLDVYQYLEPLYNDYRKVRGGHQFLALCKQRACAQPAQRMRVWPAARLPGQLQDR